MVLEVLPGFRSLTIRGMLLMSPCCRLGLFTLPVYRCAILLLTLLAGNGQLRGGDQLVNIAAALPATDGLGRKLPTHDEVGDLKEGKFVGLFYWTWHMNFIDQPPHNVREILAKKPEALYDYEDPIWPKGLPWNNYCFWDEPLFGVYRNTDHWVLQKH